MNTSSRKLVNGPISEDLRTDDRSHRVPRHTEPADLSIVSPADHTRHLVEYV